jgi:predicted AAA+ superfamily ATPase
MINRDAQEEIVKLLGEFPAVGVLGPRQVGKTTLAEEIAATINPQPLYLDMESPIDHAKLGQAEAYLESHQDRLIILDEVQRVPELFNILRGVIDRRRRKGQRTGQFLILGSASLDLLKQSSESLAGRIAYKEISVLNASEIEDTRHNNLDRLWLRGGFPDSFQSKDEPSSLRWRQNFITTYLERDVPQLGPRIPSITLRRLWTMLAHQQGGQLNTAKLAANIDVTIPTAKRYVELLEDLLLVRSLRPWSGNVGKRMVKSPKVYIRDSGLTHALLNLMTLDDLLGHPVVGASWEGFVIENLISCLPSGVIPWYYRSSGGAEIDLVIEKNARSKIAIEIKRSMTPTVSKGFHFGCEDIGAKRRFVVYPGKERYPLANGVYAIPLLEMMNELKAL